MVEVGCPTLLSAAHEAIIGDYEAQRPVGAVGDADAWGCLHFDWRLGARAAHLERAGDQIGAVELASDAHGERQFAGPRRQVLNAMGGGPPAAHGGESRERLQRANQDASGLALGLAHEIQTFIHAVDEVDVGMAGRTENHARAIGEAAPGMGSAIIGPKIRFHLDNAAGGRAMHQDLSQAIARDLDGWTRIKIATERR
jgi:hypothetical protein